MAELVDPEAVKGDYLGFKFEEMIRELELDPSDKTVLAARALTLLPISTFQFEENPFDQDVDGKLKKLQEEKQEKYDKFLKEYLSSITSFTGNKLFEYLQDLKFNIYLINNDMEPRVFRSATKSVGGRKRKTRRYRRRR